MLTPATTERRRQPETVIGRHWGGVSKNSVRVHHQRRSFSFSRTQSKRAVMHERSPRKELQAWLGDLLCGFRAIQVDAFSETFRCAVANCMTPSMHAIFARSFQCSNAVGHLREMCSTNEWRSVRRRVGGELHSLAALSSLRVFRAAHRLPLAPVRTEAR